MGGELPIQHGKNRHSQLINYMAFYNKIFNWNGTLCSAKYFHVIILCLPCSNSLRELVQVLEHRGHLRLREVSDLPKDTQGPSWSAGIHILVISLLGPVLQRKHWLCMSRS